MVEARHSLQSDHSSQLANGHNHIHTDSHSHSHGQSPMQPSSQSGTHIALAIEDLTVTFERHPALHHLDQVISKGSLLAIMGPNGSGKSTLLKALVGMVRPTSGRINWHGITPNRMAWLPQQATVSGDFPLQVLEVVTLGHWHRMGWFRGVTRDMIKASEAAIDRVGLAGFAERSINSLSVGQLQRVQFARIIVADAELILLDEPFAALDPASCDSLLQLILEWHSEGRTVIAVLHDIELVRAHFPLVMLLAREKIAYGTPKQVLTKANQSRANSMMEAWSNESSYCEMPMVHSHSVPAAETRSVTKLANTFEKTKSRAKSRGG